MENRHVGFGVLLLSIGVVLLLINLGIISWSIVESFFELWPAILIVAGINIIFHRNQVVKIIAWLAFVALIVAHSYFYGGSNVPDFFQGTGSEKVRIEKASEVEQANLRLELSGTELLIVSTSSSLVDAELASSRISHSVEYEDSKRTANVTFEETHPFGIDINFRNNKNKFSLDENVTWDMFIDTGAANGTIDMSNLKVKSLDIDVGAANLKLICSSKYPSTSVKLDAGASNIEVVVPQGTGVKVKMDSTLSSYNLREPDWEKQGEYYVSSNYDSSDNKIFFDVDMGAGKFDVSFK